MRFWPLVTAASAGGAPGKGRTADGPTGMEHCSWLPGQGRAQARGSRCLQHIVVLGQLPPGRAGAPFPPDS